MKTNVENYISNSKEFEDFMRDETKKEAYVNYSVTSYRVIHATF